MSWLARLLSPKKRRADPPSAPFTKRVRTLEEGRNEGKLASVSYPLDETKVLAFSNGVNGSSLRSLLLSALVPRPLALVASLDHSKNLTIIPSSNCAVASEDPAYISVSFSKDSLPPDSLTDALSSIEDSRDFTVNIVSEWMIDAVTEIAGSYKNFKPDREANLAASGITTSPSEQILVPRLTQAAVSLECRTRDLVNIKNGAGEVSTMVVIAEVICIVANEQVVTESSSANVVDASKLQPVAVVGADKAGRVSELYDLQLGPLDSVNDSVPPVALDGDVEEPAAAVEAPPQPPSLNEEAAVEMAAAVAETLATEPQAPAIDQIQIIMKDGSNAPARSTRSTKSAAAPSREATPISVIVQ